MRERERFHFEKKFIFINCGGGGLILIEEGKNIVTFK